jgi:hypothetical protein
MGNIIFQEFVICGDDLSARRPGGVKLDFSKDLNFSLTMVP